MKRNLIAMAVSLTVAAAMQARAADAVSSDQLEEVHVTGTRIQNLGMTTATPVTAVSSVELTEMAPTTLVNGLTVLPQFYGSATTSNFNSGANGFFLSPGGGSLNLRGLGTKRTLTLLDGRRVVDSSLFGGPDINLFPESVIKRVETVTGGASAQYGTDAVSGVVNFVLDTKFDGFRAQVQGGQTSRGDNQNDKYSLTFGHSLGEKTHIIISGEHYAEDPVWSWKGRDWYQGYGMIQSMAAGAGNSQSNPRFVPAPYVTSLNASYDGVITAWQATPGNTVPASFTRSIFNSDGSVSPFQLSNNYSTLNGAQSTLSGGSGTDNNSDRPDVEPQSSRTNAFVYLDSNLTDHFNLYFQGIWAEEMVKTTNPGGLFSAGTGQPITIFSGNPFLPASLQAQMTANNIASFTFGRIGDSLDIANNAFVENDTRIRAGTLGFKSQISSGFFKDWEIDGDVQYGETNLDARQIGGIRIDRIYLALDAVTDPATGRTVCHVTLISGQYPDCVPLNLFGRGNASQSAIAWVTGFDPGVSVTTTPYYSTGPQGTFSYVGGPDKVRDIDIQQTDAEVTASGEIFHGWGAGALSMAIGANYRKEDLDQAVLASQGNPSTDPAGRPVAANNPVTGIRGVPPGAANNSVEIQFSKVPFIKGGFNVKEAFAETLIPLVSNTLLLQQLNLNAAVRWADYSGSGTIWAYKLGLDDDVTKDFRLRATYSRDVRAANLDERFDRTGGAASVIDYGSPGNPTENITIVQGGNPSVDPEKADTVTAGFVYRPGWLAGADLSVDWLDVKLKDAIQAFTAQDIISACYRQGNTDECQYITRNPDGTIFIVNQTVQNIAQARITGVDIEGGYTHGLHLLGGGAESISWRAFASWLGENSLTSSNGVKTRYEGDTGTMSLPKWKVTSYAQYADGPFSAFLQARYIGHGKLSALYNLNGVWDVGRNYVSSATYWDMRLAYDFKVDSGALQLYGEVLNMFDKAPPLDPAYSTFGTNPTQVNPTGLFDELGRRFNFGIRLTF
ncbi:MAG TPA: TonB-dependent receptor [Steroidobacteraceae bacterium]|nr:TonB-dependent receptor [Steroidobacteraceae bacterium]